MNWQEVCERPELEDLPYKIELNRLGQIVMSPASNEHSFRQSRIIRELLRRTESGEVLPECSIDTEDGTKVADVVWFSDAFYERHGLATPYPAAPELCVEVRSPSNSDEEMAEKRRLYFAQGAEEVWISEAGGEICFFGPSGAIEESGLVSGFPKST